MKEINWKPESKIGKVFSVRLDIETEQEVEKIAKQYGIKTGTVIRRIVEHYFNEIKKVD